MPKIAAEAGAAFTRGVCGTSRRCQDVIIGTPTEGGRSVGVTADVTVFIDPPSHHYYRNNLFNPASRQNRDQCLLPYIYLKQQLGRSGIEVQTADYLLAGERLGRVNVYFSLGILNYYRILARCPDVILSGFFAVECPVNAPAMYRGLSQAARHFRRIYSYSDSKSLDRKSVV